MNGAIEIDNFVMGAKFAECGQVGVAMVTLWYHSNTQAVDGVCVCG